MVVSGALPSLFDIVVVCGAGAGSTDKGSLLVVDEFKLFSLSPSRIVFAFSESISSFVFVNVVVVGKAEDVPWVVSG